MDRPEFRQAQPATVENAREPKAAGQTRLQGRSVAVAALALGLYGCALTTPGAPPTASYPSELPLFEVAADASELAFHTDRLRCANAGEVPSACLLSQGYERPSEAATRAFVDAAYADATSSGAPQRLAIALLSGDRLLTGWTELFSRGPSAAVILDGADDRLRCDGTANLLRSETIATKPGGDALLQCTDGRVLFLRLAMDTPSAGHGIGWDTGGATYSVLFGAPELIAASLREPLLTVLTEQEGGAAALTSPPTRSQTRTEVAHIFRQLDYRLNRVRHGSASVPAHYVAALPSDMSSPFRARDRKSMFIQLMLPLVLVTNEAILDERAHLLHLIAQRQSGQELSATDQQWLTRLAQRYEVRATDFASLKYRVDAIPPSLAIGQAALETGWGTSRFAQQGNALFGEWTFGANQGIVPASRGPQQDHKIRSFETLLHSVAAYMDNLNSHPAYRDFRAQRARGRALGTPPGSRDLATSLQAYGGDTRYVQKLRTVIQANRLDEFDDARLASLPLFSPPTPRLKPDPDMQQATVGNGVFGQILDKVRTKLATTQ